MVTLSLNFLDELRARTPIATLIGRSVRLSRSGREQKGCCPFHGEKTPSFYVYDDHFHCYGCGEHGDAITFVMKSTGAPFMEAVETLAREAELEVPKASPLIAEAEQKRTSLAELLHAATEIYQRWLFMPQGRPALDYLYGRGLTDDTIRRFELGWSGEGRGALAAALRPAGITPEQLAEAGMMKSSERGPVDMFFGRVMFPIADRRGNKISFSGRILDDGQPKYVNGPETMLFSKRRSLYGLHLARDAVRKGAPLILVEGQMDVIALSQAGFAGAVAPLGTALTDEQLAEIWRMTPEPVICFDADAAGRRAALKTVDLALAALAPDRSLKFLRLPDKEDPDSIIRREGGSAFETRLKNATPLSVTLFDMLADGVSRDTPESRVSFYDRLIKTASRIPDKPLANEYRALLLSRFFGEWRPKKNIKHAPKRQFDTSQRVEIKPRDIVTRRGYVILSILIHFPEIFSEFEEVLWSITTFAPPCMDIFRILGDFTKSTKKNDFEQFSVYLDGFGLGQKARLVVATAAADYRPDFDMPRTAAADIIWHFYYLMPEMISSLEQQRNEAREQFLANPDSHDFLQRLIKFEKYLLQARSGEFGEVHSPSLQNNKQQSATNKKHISLS